MIECNFELNSFDELEFRIYTIGYSRQGESVLTILCERDKIVYSVLTDSFQKQSKGIKKFNVLDDIFENYSNPHIDAFVWTHPDLDHSVGIENTLDKYDPNRDAYIFLPSGLDRKDKYEISGKSKNAFDYLNRHYFQNNHGMPISVVSKEERKIVKLKIKEIVSGASVNVDLYFIAPSAELLLKRTANETTFTINEMSIVYAINMNGRNFLFTGDFEGKNLGMMNTDHMELLQFLKIPHHASSRSNAIINKLRMLNSSRMLQSVTQKGATPDENELEEYLKLGELYVASDDTVNDYTYGYVLFRYGVRNVNLLDSPELVGNAYQFRFENQGTL